MPANWYLTQHLNPTNGRIEWPAGPITGLDPGYEPKWVEAWAVQGRLERDADLDGPQPEHLPESLVRFCTGLLDCGRTQVEKRKLPAGLAMGISLLALRHNTLGTYEYEWWFEVVMLQ